MREVDERRSSTSPSPSAPPPSSDRPAATPASPDQGTPAWSRSAVASLIAAATAVGIGCCGAAYAWLLAGRDLDVHTDVVGYPTFRDFDSGHATRSFVLVVAVFPAVTAGTYVVLRRIVPRWLRRLRAPWADELVGVAGRIAAPGTVVGVAVAVAAQTGPRGVLLWVVVGAVAWAGVVALGALVVRRFRPRRSTSWCVAWANTALVPMTILAVSVASSSATVTVAESGRVAAYPFFPTPLAIAVVAVASVVVIRGLRRRDGASVGRLRGFEFDTVALIAGSVLAFLVTARLPGALGEFDPFHEGELLATSTLLGDGAFPWRDVLFIHGLLFDGVLPAVGLQLFEDTRWGMQAGMTLVVGPVCNVLVWVLLVRTVRRNWAVLVGYLVVLAAAGGYAGGVLLATQRSYRFVLVPLVLLALIRALGAPAGAWAAAVGALGALTCVVAPEFAFGAVAVAVVLVGFEATEGRGRPWRARFGRTLWCATGALAVSAVTAGWLVWNDAFDDFVHYFRTFVPDHALTGALPLPESPAADYVLAATLPIVLGFAYGAFVAWRLTTRRGMRPADWAMAGLALFGVLYYPKFLIRPDSHVYDAMVLAVPVLVYAIARVLEPGDRALSTVSAGSPRHLTSALAIGALTLAAVGPVVDRLGDLPARFTPEVAAEPTPARMGFARADALPDGVVDDLRTALDQLGPDAELFDFTNQPGVVHYLLGVDSPTRYPHVSMAIRRETQRDLIDELAVDPPEVVLWWSTTLGQPAWDEIINPVRHYEVSRWVLERYRPWFAVDGEVLYVRRDLDPPAPSAFADRLVGVPDTDIASATPTCAWGTTPDFLDWADRASDDAAPLHAVELDRVALVTGWVGPAGEGAITEVRAVGESGRVLASVPPSGARTDVPADEGTAAGFALTVPLAVGDDLREVRLEARSASGTARALDLPDGTATVPAGFAPAHAIEQVVETPLDPRTDVTRLDLPAGATRDHAWLEIRADGGLPGGELALTDTVGGPRGRSITFESTGRSDGRHVVPVASCPQWHDYGATSLFLQREAGGPPVDVLLQTDVAGR